MIESRIRLSGVDSAWTRKYSVQYTSAPPYRWMSVQNAPFGDFLHRRKREQGLGAGQQGGEPCVGTVREGAGRHVLILSPAPAANGYYPRMLPVPPAQGHAALGQDISLDRDGEFLMLAFSGFAILMGHPRLYWGETGNDLTPALIELRISRNYQHGGWTSEDAFLRLPASRQRESDLRHLQSERMGAESALLAAWSLVVPGVLYLMNGLVTGHFRRTSCLAPRAHPA